MKYINRLSSIRRYLLTDKSFAKIYAGIKQTKNNDGAKNNLIVIDKAIKAYYGGKKNYIELFTVDLIVYKKSYLYHKIFKSFATQV